MKPWASVHNGDMGNPNGITIANSAVNVIHGGMLNDDRTHYVFMRGTPYGVLNVALMTRATLLLPPLVIAGWVDRVVYEECSKRGQYGS
jgi:hypothetical protein